MTPRGPHRFWQYARGLAAPVLLWALFLGVLLDTYQSRLRGDVPHDEAALREWVEEARVSRETLSGLVRDYLASAGPEEQLVNGDKVREHLHTMGNATLEHQGYLPLFPTVYRLEMRFTPPRPHELFWDSQLPRHDEQLRPLDVELYHRDGQRASLRVAYVLHAFDKRQRDEQAATIRLRGVAALAVVGTLLAALWIGLVQRQRRRARQQLAAAERRHEETERKLLEQRLATQSAEQKALELKSQLYASIGIMAGSYAHNIKNLLVRPNDLLRRCLEGDGLSADREQMLHEVRQTLGTVTERLQQILRTVRRDPSRPEFARLDLNAILRDLQRMWNDLAREKWKVTLSLDLAADALWIDGDLSHLQQAIENLLFNARDATFEMRNYLREQARLREGLSDAERRQGLIDAAAWRGTVVLHARRDDGHAVLEVRDNGIGMTEEVQRRCTEAHFSTKRDSALHAGNNVGMGLGLSFVETILENHKATLEITSLPRGGTTFRIRFRLLA